ncbi:hypothetical protein D3C76_1140060 [compost metagenome]
MIRRFQAWLDESELARHQHLAQPWQVGDFLGRDVVQDLPRGLGVFVVVPKAPGLQQCIGKPQVGVGRRIAVQQAPVALLVQAPEPTRQVRLDVALGKVVLTPAPQLVKRRTVVGHQGEEHPIGLAFGRAVTLRRAGIQHSAILLHEVFGEGLPQRPRRITAVAGTCRGRQ